MPPLIFQLLKRDDGFLLALFLVTKDLMLLHLFLCIHFPCTHQQENGNQHNQQERSDHKPVEARFNKKLNNGYKRKQDNSYQDIVETSFMAFFLFINRMRVIGLWGRSTVVNKYK